MEEIELIKQYQNGINRKEIMEFFLKKYDNCLWKFARNYPKYGKEVEDAYQDNFLQMVKCLEKFDIKYNANFLTFLYRCLEHLFYNFLNTKKEDYYKRIKKTFSVEEMENFEIGKLDTYFYENKIDERILNSLTNYDIQIIIDLLKGKTQLEIAEKLGTNQPTISLKIENIRKKVKFNCYKLKNGFNPPNFIE